MPCPNELFNNSFKAPSSLKNVKEKLQDIFIYKQRTKVTRLVLGG